MASSPWRQLPQGLGYGPQNGFGPLRSGVGDLHMASGPFGQTSFGQQPGGGGYMRGGNWGNDQMPGGRERASSLDSVRSGHSAGSAHTPRRDSNSPPWGAQGTPAGPPQRLVLFAAVVIGVSVLAVIALSTIAVHWMQDRRQGGVPAEAPVLGEPPARDPQGVWYQGLDSVLVLSPTMSASALQGAVDSIAQEMEQDASGAYGSYEKGQFGVRRRAILLLPGDYGDLHIPVRWYTTVSGVGLQPSEVLVRGVSSEDAYPGSKRGSLENFWKAVEGLTLKEGSALWSISQGASLRRCVVLGDLWLSETDEEHGSDGENKHYASGGFLSDLRVQGTVHWGMQQQFFYRSSTFGSVEYQAAGQSMVFVGVEGAPAYDLGKSKPLVSTVESAPLVAEKPYLVFRGEHWHVAVPPIVAGSRGALADDVRDQAELIGMDQVYVARPGDDAARIQAGIAGKRVLLITPGIYGLAAPIRVDQPGFVVLGIGMPTLVTTAGNSALQVTANGARVAQVLLESGSEVGQWGATEPLLAWGGSDGVASDVFARLGAFSYQAPFHRPCAVTQADVMAKVDGDRVVLDNVWLWHADHDDCTRDGAAPASDQCVSGTGLVVEGNAVIAYGLSVEHTKGDLVQWNGDGGQLFFFQAELPYNSNLNFGAERHVGYRVSSDVGSHTCYGVGVYQVFKTFSMPAAVQLPQSAHAVNLFAWCITADRSGLGSLYCTDAECFEGTCDNSFCYALSVP